MDIGIRHKTGLLGSAGINMGMAQAGVCYIGSQYRSCPLAWRRFSPTVQLRL